jgi:hypothetical protein
MKSPFLLFLNETLKIENLFWQEYEKKEAAPAVWQPDKVLHPTLVLSGCIDPNVLLVHPIYQDSVILDNI